MHRPLIACVIGLFGLSIPALAQTGTTPPKDPVLTLLKSAYDKYTKQDLNGASEDLSAAQKLIDSRRGDQGLKLFPDIAGWTAAKAQKAESNAIVGGASLKRVYENKGKAIEAELVLDSPLIQQLAPLLANEDFAKVAGFETRRVDGKEALIKTEVTKIELNVLIGSGILFKLTGTGGVKENEIVSFAKQFDLRAMEKLKKDVASKPEQAK